MISKHGPMIIDTHCHLIDKAFSTDVDEVVLRAGQANVQKMILACCDETEFLPIAALCSKYPDRLFPTIGIHPENMAQDVRQQFEQLKALKNGHPEVPVCAIGEIGLDLYWDRTRLSDQLWVLEQQVIWAVEEDLPVLLHIRNAMDEFLVLLEQKLYPVAKAAGKEIRGILHCYSGTAEQAARAMQFGHFLLGIGGTLTYKKSQVPDVVRAVGLSRIVLETDAPYLAPVPYRGRRNEPAYTSVTCQAVAELLSVPVPEVEQATSGNASALFGFRPNNAQ